MKLYILLILMSLILCPIFLSAGTKKPLRIAVIDTGYTLTKHSRIKFCKTGHYDFTNTGLKDSHGHGTHITNIIASNIKGNYCIIIIKAFDPKSNKYYINKSSRNEFEYMLSIDVDVINYSAGGFGSTVEEEKYITALIKRGTKIFVAAGNSGKDLNKSCEYYPACYKIQGLNVVGSKENGILSKFSNYGDVVNTWENGAEVTADSGINGIRASSGTSQATALATAKYIREVLK